jgi:hypothetical protein
VAKAGSGHFLPRAAGATGKPLGRPAPEFDLRSNFQAKLY